MPLPSSYDIEPGATLAETWERMIRARYRQLGRDPDRPRRDRRNVMRVLRKVEGGRYEQISFRRAVNGRAIDIRVRGGCRLIAAQTVEGSNVDD